MPKPRTPPETDSYETAFGCRTLSFLKGAGLDEATPSRERRSPTAHDSPKSLLTERYLSGNIPSIESLALPGHPTSPSAVILECGAPAPLSRSQPPAQS